MSFAASGQRLENKEAIEAYCRNCSVSNTAHLMIFHYCKDSQDKHGN